MLFYKKTLSFAIFSKTSTRWYYFENGIIFSFPNITSWQNIEKIDMDFTIFGSCLILKNWSDFRRFFNTQVRNISYFYLYVRPQRRICIIVSKFRQFENQPNQNTGLCITKTVTVEFVLFWLFYSKNSDNLNNSMIFNVLYISRNVAHDDIFYFLS